MVTSFQAEGMVVLDLARQVDPGVRVLTLDTGRLPEETYEVIEAVRTGLGLEVEVITPDPADVAAMVARHGPNLFHKDPALRRLCCHVRKVAPLDRALAGVGAWATGLRRDGGPARAGTPKAELDDAHGGIVKLNPLADWTREQVWAYVRSPPPARELAVRPGLHLDRLRPLHPPDPARGGRARRALVVGGRPGPRVRPAHPAGRRVARPGRPLLGRPGPAARRRQRPILGDHQWLLRTAPGRAQTAAPADLVEARHRGG